MRDRDSSFDGDPYRTWVGTTPGRIAAVVIGVVAFFVVVIAGVAIAVAT